MKHDPVGISISNAMRNATLPRRRRRTRGADEGSRATNAEAEHARLLELLPQVRYIARRIHSRLPTHVPFDDLLQAGVVGLVDALRKFDPKRRVQLESYMKFRIRGAILDELRSLDWSPRELRRQARQLEEAEQRLRGALGREPLATELAKALGMSLAQFHRLAGELRGLELGSLQEVAAATEDGMEQDRTSRLASPEGTNPLAMCTDQEKRERLEEGIRRLPERERLALTLYYYEELTMKEVGEVLAVGESRVSQIHSAALARLREYLHDPASEQPMQKHDPAGSASRPWTPPAA
jgi:RNA polymerase sigma factor for flagellar operon FliA